jgi:hypothetical protein
MAETIAQQFGAVVLKGPENPAEIGLRCPAERVYALVEALMGSGAENVTVRALDYVFEQANPLAERLFGRLEAGTAP